ncbi:unnamed protein product, partial [marine sediment metagenome]
HKESYLTILMFLDYSIVTECFFNYRPLYLSAFLAVSASINSSIMLLNFQSFSTMQS